MVCRLTTARRERAELRRTVRSLTAEGRMTRWLLTAHPVGLIAVILLINRSYLSPLLDTTGGRLLGPAFHDLAHGLGS